MENFLFIVFLICSLVHQCRSGLLAEPAQPLNPPDDSSTPNTVPSYPVQTGSEICRLDLSAELFGGVNAACGRNLDRSRCCPVLAAWLFAAHARSALEVNASSPATSDDMPMMPDDSQNCVNSLQSSLQSRNIHIPQPNASCDAVLCFCGIRLHQLGSLSCPAAFNLTAASRNATPTAAVRNLEKSCRNSSYAGCTKCLGALQKLNGDGKNGTKKSHHEEGDRASKILRRDYMATCKKQNGVHTHCFCCTARHHVQCAPTPPVYMQPRPGKHALGRRFITVRKIELFFIILLVTCCFLSNDNISPAFGFSLIVNPSKILIVGKIHGKLYGFSNLTILHESWIITGFFVRFFNYQDIF